MLRILLAVIARSALPLALLLVPARPSAAQFEWSAPIPYPSAFPAQAVASGDLDGDGHADLLRSDPDGDAVSTLLGDGSGAFRDGALAAADDGPVAAALADFDGDEMDDAVVANAGANTISLFRSDGAGGFSSRLDLPVGERPQEIAAADVDGDGRMDVVAACAGHFAGTRGIAIWHGDGAGGFERFVVVAPDTPASRLDVADLDGNGDLDFVFGASTQTRIVLADGAGGFLDPQILSGQQFGGVTSVRAGDVDGDGDVDVAVAGDTVTGSAEILVHLGNGTGGLSRIDDRIVPPRQATRLALADLDGDGRADVIAGSSTTATPYLADGAGWFASAGNAALDATGFATTDLDADGYPDLAASHLALLDRVHETRRGTVNAGAGPIADVLLVNGSAGEGRDRTVALSIGEPFSIAIGPPPSKPLGPSQFAWFLWKAEPSALTPPTDDRFGIGRFALPTPLHPGGPRPVLFLNNIRSLESRLGPPRKPSHAAPAVIGERSAGFPRAAAFFMQAIIRDDAGPNGSPAAASNAVQLVVR